MLRLGPEVKELVALCKAVPLDELATELDALVYVPPRRLDVRGLPLPSLLLDDPPRREVCTGAHVDGLEARAPLEDQDRLLVLMRRPCLAEGSLRILPLQRLVLLALSLGRPRKLLPNRRLHVEAHLARLLQGRQRLLLGGVGPDLGLAFARHLLH